MSRARLVVEKKNFKESEVIELYTTATSNGWKPTIASEELGIGYKVHPVDLAAAEQRQESFLCLNPNGRVPVIVDRDGAVGKARQACCRRHARCWRPQRRRRKPFSRPSP